MKRILFRADANAPIGTGDLVSFLHLSEYFSKYGWESHFIIKNYKSALRLLSERKCSNCTIIKEDISIKEEVRRINRYIASAKITAVFLQISERHLQQYDSIDKEVFKACVYFNKDLPPSYDLVLSWDADSKSCFRKGKYPGTKFFLGPEYVILPIDFDCSLIQQRPHNKNRKGILIAMGGVDERNFTEKIIERLMQIKCDMEVRIVLGAGYRHKNELLKLLRQTDLGWKILEDVKRMFPVYLHCDIAIGAGGLTASELVDTRTPALLIALYEHQISRCRYFEKMGWAKYLGYRSVSALNLNDLISFEPGHSNKFNIRIEEVVRYIDKACS
jgi:spore coat polysaccharide biosynthesis predicted glycosyltransferase SpsG